jgi:hypothetical protein
MEKKSRLNFLKNTDFHALLVGLAIAVIHFFVTTLFSPLSEKFPVVAVSYLSVRDIFQFALIAPSIILFTITSRLISQLWLSDVFIYASSSFLYGLTGGVFVTKRKIPRQIGIVLLAWLVLSNCVMWFMLVIMY